MEGLRSMEKDKRSILGVNMLFNVLKTVVSVMAPLITYSYVTRILGVENIGKANFVTSVISYFQLIASLGIVNYAISEGAKIKLHKPEFNKFGTEIFTFNLFTTLMAYFLLIITLAVVKPLFAYRSLLLISSISMAFVCIGMEWLYGAMEEYKYISIRSMLLQVLDVALILFFVKDPQDLSLYVFILIIPVVVAGIINYVRKKAFINFEWKELSIKDISKHVKPTVIIWGMSIASAIYINSDTIMLTLLKGDASSGLYSVATKSSHVICLIFAAICTVLLPKLSSLYVSEDKAEFSSIVEKVFAYLLMFVFPVTAGLFMLSKEAVLLLGGESFLAAVPTAKIMAINVLLSPINGLMASQIFIPMGKQNISLYATSMGAIANVVLNIFLIPCFGINGAAFTTIFAEAIVFVYSFHFVRTFFDWKKLVMPVLQYSMGSFFIVVSIAVISLVFREPTIIGTLCKVLVSVVVYLVFLNLINNRYYIDVKIFVKNLLKKRGLVK